MGRPFRTRIFSGSLTDVKASVPWTLHHCTASFVRKTAIMEESFEEAFAFPTINLN